MRNPKPPIRHTEAKLRAVLSSIEDLILVIAADGTVVEVVPTKMEPRYRTTEELVGSRVHDRYPKEMADACVQTVRSVLATQTSTTVEYSLRIGDRDVWLNASVSPLDESSVIWIARDVTAQKAVEAALEERVNQRTRDLTKTIEALHASEERFRLLANAKTDAVCDYDLVTGAIWRGSSYATLFGYEEGQIPTTFEGWHELVHPDDRQRVDSAWKEASESGASLWSCEYRFRRADGSYAHVLDRVSIERDEQKRAVRALGRMIDLTEQRQLAEEREQTKRVASLGRIAASIAHEINNILMAIQPNAEVLQRRAPAELRSVTDAMIAAVRRGKHVTEEILRFTRPATLDLECIDVARFLERWAADVTPLLGAGIQLDLQVPSAKLYVLADPVQLGEALTDLAVNGRQAMRHGGGTLRISAELAKSWGSFRFGVVKSPDRFVHFTVRDNGPGFSSEDLPHVFEPLFNVERGAGLGLAVAHQVVMRHSGHIFVESEPGAGSTFHLFVPNTMPQIAASEPESGDLAVRRVLLVEDEPAVASGIAMLLEMDGIQVEVAGTGAAAIPAIERFQPDALILDIGLPDIDGVGLYREIADRSPKLPVIFSSGHADTANLDEYLSRPNVRFLRKPYDYETIRATLMEFSR